MLSYIVLGVSLLNSGQLQTRELDSLDTKIAIANLLKRGVKITFDTDHEAIAIDFQTKLHAEIRGVVGGFEQPDVNDRVLANLRPLTKLQSVNLAYTRITDEGMTHLAVLPMLRSGWSPSRALGCWISRAIVAILGSDQPLEKVQRLSFAMGR